MEWVTSIWGKVNRKKQLDDDILETPLRRCLGTVDLTLLGMGHMVGAGIFVLTGTVVHDVAGPATFISYIVAGIAALLSSVCYAEFGARVPKAGSAYTYTYVTMGEFWAFVIGWNILLEHIIGTASVARAFSGSFDSIFGGAIRNGTLTHVGSMHAPWLSVYPDFVAFLVTMLVMGFIASGARISINFNNICTVVNVLIILLIISVGLSVADSKNWTDAKRGGFLPFGFPGVFAGAASCFYSYIGFEGIAVAGEEAENPARSIPLATGISMTLVTLLYVGSSSTLTLMVPYMDVDKTAPFPAAFAQRGIYWAKYVIAIGALFGIITSLIGGLYSLPRSVYSIASDGLLFKAFAYVHPKTQTPIVAIIVFGGLAALFSLLFDIDTLVEFLSIGTLLSFTIVAASVLVLRYQPADKCQFKLKPEDVPETEEDVTDTDKKQILKSSQSHDDIGRLRSRFESIPYLKDLSPGNASVIAVVGMVLFMLLFNVLLLHGYTHVKRADWWAIILLLLFGVGILLNLGVLLVHEQNTSFLTFQVPLVPFVPALSMMVNIAMMVKLSYLTWIRLIIWFVVGLVIYFAYGIRHSKENRPLSAYSHVVSYSGQEGDNSSAPKMNESLHVQQPQGDAPLTEMAQ